MSPELILAIITGCGTLVSGTFAGLAGFASSRSKRAAEDITHLKSHLALLDVQINALQTWQYAARLYIATLRGVLADRGITAPEPPPELNLTAPTAPAHPTAGE